MGSGDDDNVNHNRRLYMNTNDTDGGASMRAGNSKGNLLTLDFSRPVPVIYQDPRLEICSDCRDEVPALVGGLCGSCRMQRLREQEADAERAYEEDCRELWGEDSDIDANDGEES